MTIEYVCLFGIAGGVMALGAALIYGSLKPRTLHPNEKVMQDKNLREIYEKDDHAA